MMPGMLKMFEKVLHQHSVYATEHNKAKLHVLVNVLYREFTYEVVQKKREIKNTIKEEEKYKNGHSEESEIISSHLQFL